VSPTQHADDIHRRSTVDWSCITMNHDNTGNGSGRFRPASETDCLKSNEIMQMGLVPVSGLKRREHRTPIKSPVRSFELNDPISHVPVTWRTAVIFTRNHTVLLVFLSSELDSVTVETMLDAQLHSHHQRATHTEHGNKGVTHSHDDCDSQSVWYE
jgi:hypothetical protein